MKMSKLAGTAWLVALCTAGTAWPKTPVDRTRSRWPRSRSRSAPGTSSSRTRFAPPSASPAVPEKPAVEKDKADEAAAGNEKSDEDKGFKLFKGEWLKVHRIDIRGWVDQGYTYNPDRPAIGFNGPVGYNNHSNEYMMNQFYLITERVTKPEDGCWDWGGRVNLLYGTDRRSVTANGLDNR